MTDERPLHVRVAEALGWTELVESHSPPMWLGRLPTGLDMPGTNFVASIDRQNRIVTIGSGSVPRYDTDWSATGPIIERLRVHVGPVGFHRPPWEAFKLMGEDQEDEAYSAPGQTPLGAVCDLLLLLHEAGRLADLLKANK